MPGMKAVGKEEKYYAKQQYEQSDESETCLLLLHVVAVFDENERRLIVLHANRWIGTFCWPGVSYPRQCHGFLKSSVSQAARPKWWTSPRCMHCFILKVNRLLKNITFPLTSSVCKGNKVRVEWGVGQPPDTPDSHWESPKSSQWEHMCTITSAWGGVQTQ